MEEYAYVVDFLPHGKGGLRNPVVQLVGESNFTLLEAILYEDKLSNVGERLFVGKGKREKVEKIKRKLSYADLTTLAKENLPSVVEKIVRQNEKRFVEFINKARPISIRVHMLELLPGVGKKNLEALLEEREKKPFESFADIRKRVPIFGDPVKSFVERIIREIKGEEKYYFFVIPPRRFRRERR